MGRTVDDVQNLDPALKGMPSDVAMSIVKLLAKVFFAEPGAFCNWGNSEQTTTEESGCAVTRQFGKEQRLRRLSASQRAFQQLSVRESAKHAQRHISSSERHHRRLQAFADQGVESVSAEVAVEGPLDSLVREIEKGFTAQIVEVLPKTINKAF